MSEKTLTRRERLRYFWYAFSNLLCIVGRLGFDTEIVSDFFWFNLKTAWSGKRVDEVDSVAPWGVGSGSDESE